MTKPRQPDDHPAPEQKPDQSHAPNGIPEGAGEAEAKGYPHSDREDTETAAKNTSSR
jgi:hypothetical protein